MSSGLPVLPQVAGQVVSLSNDPNAELGELSSLIHQDQALAGHLLRISNSVAYRGGEDDRFLAAGRDSLRYANPKRHGNGRFGTG